ncbi:YbaB/EbfC family nucleoid-associated protein [Nocardia paucivorans]|uniref:YbaB/EbfC family nucleoid-associated protein n=1 Tax=Nocardia paucivorans TaxID=114259 RepID=UPI0002DA37D7|nr:YbaB/EbfC family nucleoid-associated protein [Nocardia paucivorans]
MDELEARVHRSLERMRDLADKMTAVRVRESSPDGVVTVVVDGNGALVDLELSTGVAKLSPAEFEQVLVGTAGRAAQRAFAERADLVVAFNEEAAEESGHPIVSRE